MNLPVVNVELVRELNVVLRSGNATPPPLAELGVERWTEAEAEAEAEAGKPPTLLLVNGEEAPRLPPFTKCRGGIGGGAEVGGSNGCCCG